MLTRLSLIALCACLIATPAFAKEKAAFACAGVFGPDSSETLLKTTYGAENVVNGTIPGAEGEDMPATTVFPNDPNKTMQFVWQDDATRKGLAFVNLSPSVSGPHGVKVGMSVDEVVAVNGQPFNIGGFWWDYGGYAQIDTGKLAETDPTGCFVSLRFSPADSYPDSLDVSTISGEVTVPSSEPLLKKVDTRLTEVQVSYATDGE